MKITRCRQHVIAITLAAAAHVIVLCALFLSPPQNTNAPERIVEISIAPPAMPTETRRRTSAPRPRAPSSERPDQGDFRSSGGDATYFREDDLAPHRDSPPPSPIEPFWRVDAKLAAQIAVTDAVALSRLDATCNGLTTYRLTSWQRDYCERMWSGMKPKG